MSRSFLGHWSGHDPDEPSLVRKATHVALFLLQWQFLARKKVLGDFLFSSPPVPVPQLMWGLSALGESRGHGAELCGGAFHAALLAATVFLYITLLLVA